MFYFCFNQNAMEELKKLISVKGKVDSLGLKETVAHTLVKLISYKVRYVASYFLFDPTRFKSIYLIALYLSKFDQLYDQNRLRSVFWKSPNSHSILMGWLTQWSSMQRVSISNRGLIRLRVLPT